MFKVCWHFLNLLILSKIINFYKNRTCSVYHPGLADASLVTVPQLYQVNGKTVPSGESQVLMTKTGEMYEAANPKHCGRALTFVNILHIPFSKRRQNKGRETRIYIYIIGSGSGDFSVSLQSKSARGNFLLILISHKCGIIYTCFHAFMLTSYTAFM